MNTLTTVIGSAISVLTLAPMVVVRIFLSDDPFASIFTVNVSYVEVEPCSNGVSNWINYPITGYEGSGNCPTDDARRTNFYF